MTIYSYSVLPRPAQLGGGWNLNLMEGDLEVGGGVFPPGEDSDASYNDAVDAGEDWLCSRAGP